MSRRTEAFVRSLVERFPALRPLLHEHLADNFGEMLPHVFFGDLTRRVLSLLDPSEDKEVFERRSELRDILTVLEAAYASGDEELQELISVSFLEHLPRPGEPGAAIRQMLGPTLSEQLLIIG
jgi:hypothetical protein